MFGSLVLWIIKELALEPFISWVCQICSEICHQFCSDEGQMLLKLINNS